MKRLTDFYEEDLERLPFNRVEELLNEYMEDEEKTFVVSPRLLRKYDIHYFEDLTFTGRDPRQEMTVSVTQLKKIARDTTIGMTGTYKPSDLTLAVSSTAIKKSNVIEVGNKMFELTQEEVNLIGPVISLNTQIRILQRLICSELLTLDEVIGYGVHNQVARVLSKNEIDSVGEYLRQISYIEYLYDRSILMEKCWDVYHEAVIEDNQMKFPSMHFSKENVYKKEAEYPWWVKEKILQSKHLI